MATERVDLNNVVLRQLFASNKLKNERPMVNQTDLVDDKNAVYKNNYREIVSVSQGSELKEYLAITLEESRDIEIGETSMFNSYLSVFKGVYNYFFGCREVAKFTQAVYVASVRDPFMPDIDDDTFGDQELKKKLISFHTLAFIDETVLDGTQKIPERTPVKIVFMDNNKEQAIITKFSTDQIEINLASNQAANPPLNPQTQSAAPSSGPQPQPNVSANVPPPTGRFLYPLANAGAVGSKFGPRFHPVHKEHRLHNGQDYKAPSGTPIYAADSGQVTKIYSQATHSKSEGNGVAIKHSNGYTTYYFHMVEAPMVSQGQTVTRGQMIGKVGSTGASTGPHLHFTIRNPSGNTIDPLTLVDETKWTP